MSWKCLIILAFMAVIATCLANTEGSTSGGQATGNQRPTAPIQRKRRAAAGPLSDDEMFREKREEPGANKPDLSESNEFSNRKKRSTEDIELEKREAKIVDGGADTRELEIEAPLKRKKRAIVFHDHDVEMDAEEHKRWKRRAGGEGEGSISNEDPELNQE